MELDIGFRERIDRPGEATALYSVARQHAFACQQVSERRRDVLTERRETQRVPLPAASVMHPDGRMIMQVGSDPGKLMHNIDTELLQMGAGPDTGSHEYRR